MSVAAVLALWLPVPTVSAQPVPRPMGAGQGPLSASLTGEVRDDYEAGMTLYRNGDYGGALVKFAAVYERSKDYRLLFHMVTAERNLGHYASAIKLLDRFVEEGGDRLSPSVRAHAAALRNAMKPFLDGAYDTTGSALCNRLNGRWEVGATLISRPVPGENGMLVVCASPDDEIDIDGKNVAIGTFTGFLSPGSHHVVVKAPGKIPHKAHVVVSSGERSTLLITLQKRTAPTYPGASDPIVRKAVSRMVIGVLDLAVRGMLAGGLR